MDFNPERFQKIYDENKGRELWDFLNENDNLVRMETATYLSRPALEPLSPFLKLSFPEVFDGEKADRTKQLIGRMVRVIMEGRGYRLDQTNVVIKREGNMFSRASRYIRG